MAERRNSALFRTALASASLLGAGGAVAADCGALAGKSFGAAMVTSAASVSPPSKFFGLNSRAPVALSGPMCRVEGAIATSPDSRPLFELWLPPPEGWNGKYEGVGNGGFAGSIIYESMDWALGGGYAVSGTDTGHSGTPFESGWAAGHPEKIVDFGWRAIHETAIASKAIVEAYYGKAPSHAYFSGCSDGGREALMEAQRFPKDYDGVVAGAPANYWTRLSVNSVASHQALTATHDSWLSPEKLAVVSKAAVEACHGVDGVIDDPGQCHFDPKVLACNAGAPDPCLSGTELTALERIYAGAHDSKGNPINPGYPPGGESLPIAWPLWFTGTEPKRTDGTLLYAFETGFYRDMVVGDPNWGYRGQNLDALLQQANDKMGGTVDATDTVLNDFRQAGGKLIQYHGWADAAIPPASSIKYYEDVAARMGGEKEIASFYRLFMAPGMQHCGGGIAPSAVGGVFGAPPPSRDPEHDLVSALAHWVEDGVAPETIVATRYRDDDPSKGVAAQRPWCPHPAVAHLKGDGPHADAASFVCSGAAR